jgi:hypothetical protein
LVGDCGHFEIDEVFQILYSLQALFVVHFTLVVLVEQKSWVCRENFIDLGSIVILALEA